MRLYREGETVATIAVVYHTNRAEIKRMLGTPTFFERTEHRAGYAAGVKRERAWARRRTKYYNETYPEALRKARSLYRDELRKAYIAMRSQEYARIEKRRHEYSP
jgi:hypothetical protein